MSTPTNPPIPPTPRIRELCLICNRSRATCFCGFVKPFDTQARFVLLMHPKEFKRQSTGTGRLASLALRNSGILMGVDFTDDATFNQILSDRRYHPVILFPGNGSVNLSEGDALHVPQGKTLLIVVLDGTWRLARKIMHMSKNLHTLPRICFTPKELSRFRIKRQPEAYCVSTIEAVHHLLDVMETRGLERLDGRHDTLIEAIDSLVRFQESYIGKGEPRHFKRRVD